jgi:hypothetical protein
MKETDGDKGCATDHDTLNIPRHSSPPGKINTSCPAAYRKYAQDPARSGGIEAIKHHDLVPPHRPTLDRRQGPDPAR